MLTSKARKQIADVNLGYDAYGRQSWLTDGVYIAPSGSHGEVFAYDDLDDLTSKTVNFASSGALSGFQMTYAYNPDGKPLYTYFPMIAAGGTSNSAGAIGYNYTNFGALRNVNTSLGECPSWVYDADHRLSTMSMRNTDSRKTASPMATTTYTYDARSNVADMKTVTGQANPLGIGHAMIEFGGPGGTGHPSPMTYDAPGNRLTMPVTVSLGTNYSRSPSYTYDYKNELTGESSSTGPTLSNSFTYDYAGNPTTMRSGTTQSFNSDNQLSATGYSYDGNGNPTTYTGKTLTYDPENRLTSYVNGGTTELTAGYGADGLRVWKTDASGNKTYFLYDGHNPVAEINSSGIVTRVNTFGPTGLICTNSLAYSSADGSVDDGHYYVDDPQGSPAMILSDDTTASAILASYDYDAFGNLLASNLTSGMSADPYSSFGSQWGYYADASTGLELLGHRYYDPGQGRFVTRDPIGYDGGIDLHGYCRNGPFEYTDSLGFEPTMGNQLPTGDEGGVVYAPPSRGAAPLDQHGNPIDLHHVGQDPDGNVDEMIWGTHRGKGNYNNNHDPKCKSRIDRDDFNKWKKKYWKEQWDSGRFRTLPSWSEGSTNMWDYVDWNVVGDSVIGAGAAIIIVVAPETAPVTIPIFATVSSAAS